MRGGEERARQLRLTRPPLPCQPWGPQRLKLLRGAGESVTPELEPRGPGPTGSGAQRGRRPAPSLTPGCIGRRFWPTPKS
jgi:hypothetical protein